MIVEGTPLRHNPLPDTGALEQDLIEAFARRWKLGRSVEARAWARLLDERHNTGVETIAGDAVDERRAEWRYMVTRAIERRELPAGTDEQMVLGFVRAIVDLRRAQPLDVKWLEVAVRTVVAGAGARTLVRAGGKRAAAGRRRAAGSSTIGSAPRSS